MKGGGEDEARNVRRPQAKVKVVVVETVTQLATCTSQPHGRTVVLNSRVVSDKVAQVNLAVTVTYSEAPLAVTRWFSCGREALKGSLASLEHRVTRRTLPLRTPMQRDLRLGCSRCWCRLCKVLAGCFSAFAFQPRQNTSRSAAQDDFEATSLACSSIASPRWNSLCSTSHDRIGVLGAQLAKIELSSWAKQVDEWYVIAEAGCSGKNRLWRTIVG
jgi:hypothetical protein